MVFLTAALIVTVGGALIANNRWLMGRIDKGDESLSKSMGRIHERIDEIPNIYVRRADLMDHLQAIEKALDRTNDQISHLTVAIMNHVGERAKEG